MSSEQQYLKYRRFYHSIRNDDWGTFEPLAAEYIGNRGHSDYPRQIELVREAASLGRPEMVKHLMRGIKLDDEKLQSIIDHAEWGECGGTSRCTLPGCDHSRQGPHKDVIELARSGISAMQKASVNAIRLK